jgi:cell division protein FtsW (lipid II flippase)
MSTGLPALYFGAPRRVELGLIALALLASVGAFLLLELALFGTVTTEAGVFGAAAGLIALLAHLFTRWLAPNADPTFLPVALLLNGLGWVMIYRLDQAQAVAAVAGAHLAFYQAAWTAIGIGAYCAVLFFLEKPADLERYRFMLLGIGAGLLLLPLVPHIGETINGARLWVRLGPVSFQPVELAKIALVIFFASYFSEKRELLSHFTARLGRHRVPDMRAFGPVLLAWGFAMLAMTAERNVGFALLIFVIFLSMIWLATGRFAYLVIGAVLFVLGALAAEHMFGQVHERIAIWLDPWRTAQTTGYQIIQAEYAFGSGGLAGTGLGLGHPWLVPVVWADFIFAAFGEELGLAGTVILVAAYLVIVGAGLRAALRSRGDFSKLVATGMTTVLGLQAFFIMAGDVRLLPLTGLSLPWVAYGGSSLVANYMVLAILVRVSDDAESGLLRRSRLLPSGL